MRKQKECPTVTALSLLEEEVWNLTNPPSGLNASMDWLFIYRTLQYLRGEIGDMPNRKEFTPERI